jgi:hypothetical protein
MWKVENQNSTRELFTAPRGSAVQNLTVSLLIVLSSTVLDVHGAPGAFTFKVIAGQAGSRGSKDGPATEALFNFPVGIVRDAAGNIYVSEWYSAVRRIAPDGTVTTIAGKSGENGFVDGPGPEARFHTVASLVIDSAGNLYATDFYNHALRKITPNGNVSTLAGGTFGFADGVGLDAQFIWPEGIALEPSGNLVITDHYAENMRRITPGAS